MKKTLIFLLSFALVTGCSSDDEQVDNEEENQNGFTFNNSFFSAGNVYVNDENIENDEQSDIAIIMSNVDLFTVNQSSNVNFVYFDFKGVDIQEGTITNVTDYRILYDASVNDSRVENGMTIINDTEDGLTASSTTIVINSVSSTDIDFEFTFIKENGDVINGNYSGGYTELN
ncbi:hypothetical protein [Autumnicola psychrophila]|uniref:Lipoprotein n=1 Tax=Autumnicola psychrophila TaxID=3075592 RepID=A0ABU3DR74_9FLAO|nr:hypothetical protein [Zunongwangia sp. F225]MDT0685979.1 hypothetical protein [Zunongwangia sp. F225]